MQCTVLRYVFWAELHVTVRHHSQTSQCSLRNCYRLLQLPEAPPPSRAQVQEAYLRLAKIYHPDSATPTSNSAVFSQIQEAYRVVLADLAKRQEEEEQEGEDKDERETKGRKALQHRHYLSYEGVGSGPPSQRERTYRHVRADRASELALEYRRQELERAAARDEGVLAARDTRKRSRQIQITQAVERLVEDLIQESMARGDFQNLSGAGKPLCKFEHNPYADPMTHNLNRILIDNGYQPQWIVAQKEIREAVGRLREELLGCRARLGDPLSPSEKARWDEHCRDFGVRLTQLNKKVDDFNLIVPLLSKQMVHFSLQRELERVVRAEQERRREREQESEREKEIKRQQMGEKKRRRGQGVFSWLHNLLK